MTSITWEEFNFCSSLLAYTFHYRRGLVVTLKFGLRWKTVGNCVSIQVQSNMLWLLEMRFRWFPQKMFIVHVWRYGNQFETFIDRTIIVGIWIVGVDVLFRSIGCVVDVVTPFVWRVRSICSRTDLHVIQASHRYSSLFPRSIERTVTLSSFVFKDFDIWKLNGLCLQARETKVPLPFPCWRTIWPSFCKVIQALCNSDWTNIIHHDQFCFCIKFISTAKLTRDDFVFNSSFNILVFWNSHNFTSILFLQSWFYHKYRQISNG